MSLPVFMLQWLYESIRWISPVTGLNWPRGWIEVALPFRDLGARRGWVVSTTPLPLYPRERPDTHCTGGWVGPRAGLDVCEKSHPTGIRSPGRPVRSQSLYRLSYPAHWLYESVASYSESNFWSHYSFSAEEVLNIFHNTSKKMTVNGIYLKDEWKETTCE
jgi:hypothetical protein